MSTSMRDRSNMSPELRLLMTIEGVMASAADSSFAHFLIEEGIGPEQREAFAASLGRLMVPSGELLVPAEPYQHEGMPRLVAGEAAISGIVISHHSMEPKPVRHRWMTVDEARGFAGDANVRVNSSDEENGTVELRFKNEGDWSGSVGVGLRYSAGEEGHVYEVVTLEGNQASSRKPVQISSSIGYAAPGSEVDWLPHVEAGVPNPKEALAVIIAAAGFYRYGKDNGVLQVASLASA